MHFVERMGKKELEGAQKGRARARILVRTAVNITGQRMEIV